MKQMVAKNRQTARGFTLLEVLISVALISVIFIIIAGALQFSVRAWRKADTSITAMQDVAFAQSIIRQTLEEAYPRLGGDGYIDFTGDIDGVRFIGPTPNAINTPTRSHITISTVDAEDGVAISIEFRPEFTEDTVRETLIEGFSDVSFAFLPPKKDGAPPPEWTDKWAGEARLPALIKIDAQPHDEDMREWPTLLIAPQIDVDAACRYDPLTNFCQGRRQ